MGLSPNPSYASGGGFLSGAFWCPSGQGYVFIQDYPSLFFETQSQTLFALRAGPHGYSIPFVRPGRGVGRLLLVTFRQWKGTKDCRGAPGFP